MPRNRNGPERGGHSFSGPKQSLQSGSNTASCGGYSANLLEGRRGPDQPSPIPGKSNIPYGDITRARGVSHQHPPVFGLGIDKAKFHLEGLWHIREPATHILNGQVIEMNGLRAEGFQKLREDSPASWARERTARSFPRWSHDATGIMLSGNSRPRYVEFSVSRILHGINLFTVTENDLNGFPEVVSEQIIPIISGVVNEGELGKLTSLELFVNLPLTGDILDELEGRENGCFRSRNEYVADYGHYRRGSQKTLVFYVKSAELFHCQGYTAVELRRRGWGKVLRVELRLRGVAQVRRILHPDSPETVESICMEKVYHLIKRHVLAYDLPELSRFFPESYHQFQSQEWSRKSC